MVFALFNHGLIGFVVVNMQLMALKNGVISQDQNQGHGFIFNNKDEK